MSEAEVKGRKAPKVNLAAGKDEETGALSVTVAFPDGHNEVFHFTHEHAMLEHFAVHGIGSKVRQTIATIKEPAKQKEAVRDLFTAFNKGQWNAYRAEGSAESGAGILARALSALYGKSIEEAEKFVSALSKKQQADMRRVKEVAMKINELNEGKVSEEAKSMLAGFAAATEEPETADAE
jgi:hypothetical protein